LDRLAECQLDDVELRPWGRLGPQGRPDSSPLWSLDLLSKDHSFCFRIGSILVVVVVVVVLGIGFFVQTAHIRMEERRDAQDERQNRSPNCQ
jgi:hypothetical protein